MISPDEDWLVNDKCSTALYMTQFFNTFEFWMSCAPVITIIAIIYPGPSRMKGCFFFFLFLHHPQRLEKAHTLSFPRLRIHNPFLAV